MKLIPYSLEPCEPHVSALLLEEILTWPRISLRDPRFAGLVSQVVLPVIQQADPQTYRMIPRLTRRLVGWSNATDHMLNRRPWF